MAKRLASSAQTRSGRYSGRSLQGARDAGTGIRFKPSNTGIFEYVKLEQLFTQNDIISLHCPLTSETRYIINANNIARMKPGVMFINTSRGGLVGTEALIRVEGKKNKQCGLDVYEEEG